MAPVPLLQALEPLNHGGSGHFGRIAVAGLHHQVAALGVGWQFGVGIGLAGRVQGVLGTDRYYYKLVSTKLLGVTPHND